MSYHGGYEVIKDYELQSGSRRALHRRSWCMRCVKLVLFLAAVAAIAAFIAVYTKRRSEFDALYGPLSAFDDVQMNCAVFTPFSNWRAAVNTTNVTAPSCPAAPGVLVSCTSDSDCTSIPDACTFGNASAQLRCRSNVTGTWTANGTVATNSATARYCSIVRTALPPTIDAFWSGGYCNASEGVTCGTCTGGGCRGWAMCVPVANCGRHVGGNTYSCYAPGTSDLDY